MFVSGTRHAQAIRRILVEREIIPKEWTVKIARTRAGHWQLAAGAWRFFALCYDRSGRLQNTDIGSQWTATEVIAADKVGNLHHNVDRFGFLNLDCDGYNLK